ncbi:MAG TPA: hypothetical protein VFN25_02710 [Dokdonella sp.]|uniref:hypothetical protein n=1 Tax=Dokdonella sp. TaxID=2291710 RepID=UPI002D7F8A25|nr:hypothetical protein [Dokdonella sp.]HET9031796.1 hypothetical protein [Dokdonella sp.]
MSLRNVLALMVVSFFLASCGSGPVKRVSPPTASIQELSVRPDGSWHLRIRVQNFSNVSMTFSAIDAKLEIADSEVGSITLPLKLDIPGESADVFETDMIPLSSTRPQAGDFAYRLHGKISSSEPKGNFNFERKSRLSPAPGLVDTWR